MRTRLGRRERTPAPAVRPAPARPLRSDRAHSRSRAAAQHLGLDLGIRRSRPGPSASVSSRVSSPAVQRVRWFLGHERPRAVGAPPGSHSGIGAARREPQAVGFVHGPGVYGGASRMVRMPADSTTESVPRRDARPVRSTRSRLDKVIASLLADGLTPAGFRRRCDTLVWGNVRPSSRRPPPPGQESHRTSGMSNCRMPQRGCADRPSPGCMARALRPTEIAPALPEPKAVVGMKRGRRVKCREASCEAASRAGESARPASSAPGLRRGATWEYVRWPGAATARAPFCALPRSGGQATLRVHPNAIEARAQAS